MSQRIECRVADVLSNQILILNVGYDDGVIPGMVFEIVDQREVRDPSTNEHLDTVELVKTAVKVFRVHEKVSLARTFLGIGSGNENYSENLVMESFQVDKYFDDEWDKSVSVNDIAVQNSSLIE